MLDTDTKRRIDTARDILVGKVPDPKSQVEQITIALIYKFMDDMDAEAEELGGKRKFFAGDYARYGWAKLMRSGLGGHETLNLYAEAIAKMPENPGIPLLFRDIFKNAYLPYRDPETLRAFLKIVDEFSYDHSEPVAAAPTVRDCLKIDTYDSSSLSSNSTFIEMAWKVDVSNSCQEAFAVKVIFKLYDKDDFELDTDTEALRIEGNSVGKARGKMLVSPPEKARRMATQGVGLRY